MTDLRKAAEMALDVLRKSVGHSNQSQTRIDDAKHALVQALAQPEQKPVAYVTIEPALDGDWRKCPSIKWFNKPTEGPLYTAPPKREWQGLTDEESIGLLQKAAKHKSPNYCTAPEMAVEFGRLASEVLREKNT